MSAACEWFAAVDAHFAGRSSPGQEQAMRKHLPTCAACRARYERHRLLAQVDPKAMSAQNRLARGLGISSGPRLAWRSVPWAVGVAVAAALAVVVFRPGNGFEARGSPRSWVSVYRLDKGGHAVPLGGTMAAGDELAFAYANAASKRHLLVFGVDEHKHVYWYHPSWSDPAQNPVAIAIEAGPSVHELPEAISHAIDGQRLALHALFVDDALTVKDVESKIAGPATPLEVPGGADQVTSIDVTR